MLTALRRTALLRRANCAQLSVLADGTLGAEKVRLLVRPFEHACLLGSCPSSAPCARAPVLTSSSSSPGGQLAPIGQGEFKKLVYDSKFTKRAVGMSFVNSCNWVQ